MIKKKAMNSTFDAATAAREVMANREPYGSRAYYLTEIARGVLDELDRVRAQRDRAWRTLGRRSS